MDGSAKSASDKGIYHPTKQRRTAVVKGWTQLCRCTCSPHLHTRVDRLVKFEETPSDLQFNEFILDGYRQPLTYKGCLISCLTLHNETGNIVSHGVACIVFLYILCTQIWPEAPWIYFTSMMSLVVCMFNSVLYHVFMNYTPSYDRWLLLDVLGIFGSFFVCELGIIWFGLKCFPWLRPPLLVGYYTVALWSGFKASSADTMAGRASYMSILGFTRGVILITRMCLYAGRPRALYTYIAMDISGLLGAIINVSKIPERWYPGKFDMFLNSHQIMHAFAFAALYLCYVGLTDDYEFYVNPDACSAHRL